MATMRPLTAVCPGQKPRTLTLRPSVCVWVRPETRRPSWKRWHRRCHPEEGQDSGQKWQAGHLQAMGSLLRVLTPLGSAWTLPLSLLALLVAHPSSDLGVVSWSSLP